MFGKQQLLTMQLPAALVLSLCVSGQVWAGQTPVVLPDSSSAGVGDSLAQAYGDSRTDGAVQGQINRAVVATVETIRAQRAVPTVAGNFIAVPQQTIDLIVDAMEATGAAVEPAMTAVARQLAREGVQGSVSLLGDTPSDYDSAVQSMNAFIDGLNSEQLGRALASPTLMTLHKMLSGRHVEGTLVEGAGVLGSAWRLLRVSAL